VRQTGLTAAKSSFNWFNFQLQIISNLLLGFLRHFMTNDTHVVVNEQKIMLLLG